MKRSILLLCVVRYITQVLCLICVFVTGAVTAQEVAPQRVKFDFEGNKVVSTTALREVAADCVNQRSGSPGRFESGDLDVCLGKIRLFLFGKAYLRATVGKPRQEETESGLRVIIPVEEGLPYRLGEVKIEGAVLFSYDQIVGMLELERGDFASGEVLNDWLAQKLKHAYANHGYIQFTYDLEPHFRPIASSESEGIVDLSVSIEEGQVFTIRRIIFRGNSQTSDKLLLSALLLREGDTFSQEIFDNSIKKLNQLGLFEDIIRDRDIEWKAPGGASEIDLIFHLKERIH